MAENKENNFNWADIILDPTNAVEQIPIGPSEEERNDSRLESVITGKDRPLSHNVKEVTAWGATNVGVPLLATFLKAKLAANAGYKSLGTLANYFSGSKTGDQLSEGISKVAEMSKAGGKGFSKEAKKAIKADAKEGLETIQKSAETVGDLDKGIKSGKFVNKDPKKILKEKNDVLSNAKDLVKSTDTISSAIKSSNADTKAIYDSFYKKYEKTASGKLRPKERIIRLMERDPAYINAMRDIQIAALGKGIEANALKNGAKIGALTLGAKDILHMAENLPPDTGAFSEKSANLKLPKAFDPKLENGPDENLSNVLRDFIDLNHMDPKKFPMDKVDALLKQLNSSEDGLGKYWNPLQINNLSDSEKVRLIFDIANGKYNTDDNNLTYELRKVYKNLTNNTEE